MKTTLTNSILFIIICTLIGCSSKPNADDGQSTADLKEQKTLQDIEKAVKDFPPPSLVPFTLKSIGAAFDREHINSLENRKAYQGNTDKMAMNIGVYASDISYLAAYGHEEDCINYLKVSHEMAEALGENNIYGEKELNEFRGHIKSQNEEEIADILSKLFLETSMTMEQDHKLTMAGLALTGSFIEGLYQAVITLEKYENTEANNKLLEPLVKIVLDEEPELQDLIQVLDDLPSDDMILEIMTELEILDRLYKGDLEEVEQNMKNNPDYVLTKEVMRDITLEVKRIRNSIVTITES
jgi:hypothetical protein